MASPTSAWLHLHERMQRKSTTGHGCTWKGVHVTGEEIEERVRGNGIIIEAELCGHFSAVAKE
jgi:hypothetical protein